jgi:hypothetical protein
VTSFGRIWRVSTALLTLALTLGAPAAAQDDATTADALEQLRLLVPEGRPATYDIDEADAIYGQLAGLAARTAATSRAGDGSGLTGPCGGFAYSYDRHGFVVDAAADLGDEAPPIDLLGGGQGFTGENPFKVDPSGIVLYYGFAPRDGEGPIDHRWVITTSGGSVDDGGADNLRGANRRVGVIDVAEHVPFDFSAVFEIDGDLTSQNLADCVGDGYMVFVGPGLISPIGFATLAVLVMGIVGVTVHARPTRRQPT